MASEPSPSLNDLPKYLKRNGGDAPSFNLPSRWVTHYGKRIVILFTVLAIGVGMGVGGFVERRTNPPVIEVYVDLPSRAAEGAAAAPADALALAAEGVVDLPEAPGEIEVAYQEGGQALTPASMFAVLDAAGWPTPPQESAFLTAKHESGLNPRSIADRTAAENNAQFPEICQGKCDAEYSVGLFNVNALAHPEFDRERLRNPVYNAWAALQIWRSDGETFTKASQGAATRYGLP